MDLSTLATCLGATIFLIALVILCVGISTGGFYIIFNLLGVY